MLGRLIQEEKLNRCHGCVIQHPSQREHSCLMMDREEAWLFYHDETRENIDVNDVLKTANNVCSLIGFKLSNSCETYVRELYKFLGLNSLSRLWNSKSLAREHKRNNWKTAFCMPLITVQTVSNPTILVTWRSQHWKSYECWPDGSAVPWKYCQKRRRANEHWFYN